MTTFSVLERLTTASGPAGFEGPACAVLAEILGEMGISSRIDPLGSLIAELPASREGAPTLLLDAHIDEIGLIVSSIDEKGFVKFGSLGGADARIMPDCEVTILADPPIDGVLCCLPPHVQKPDEMKSFAAPKDMAIDCGMSKEALEARVKTGTPVVFKSLPRVLANNRFVSKSLDNRLCAAVIACALEKVKDHARDYNIVFTASVMEEVGGRGAKAAAFGVDPNAAVVLDVTFGEAKGSPANDTFALDALTVCVGPECDRALTGEIRKAAAALEIQLESEVYARSTGTNGTPIQITRAGVPTAVLSLPIRNMHTPVELVSLDTADKAVDLLAKFLDDLKGGDLL